MKRRKVLIALALFLERRGESPTWGELCAMTGYNRAKMRTLLRVLKRDGLVDFERQTRSLVITEAGMEAARSGRPVETAK